MNALSTTEVRAEALSSLRPLGDTAVELDARQRDRVRAALDSGATWGEIGEAISLTSERARRLFTTSTCVALDAVAASNSDLEEDEVMELAVSEVQAVRCERLSG